MRPTFPGCTRKQRGYEDIAENLEKSMSLKLRYLADFVIFEAKKKKGKKWAVKVVSC